MKVLISALACEPGRGSELEVGFRTMLAAARRHDVWVLTNAASIPSLEAAISGTERAAHIHLEGIDLGLDHRAFARMTAASFHWNYDRWQRLAAARALVLDRQVDFDVVHHVTLASYWTRAAAAVVDKPLVWGPVGGGVETPWRLIPELGLRGMAEDLGRLIIRGPMGRIGPARRPQQKAEVILAQNQATADRLKTHGDVLILSNATVVDLEPVGPSAPRTKDIYLVGRLVPWKAPILAVRMMRYVEDEHCMLHICGEGPEQRRLERAARRWGVDDRISFDGWLPRDVLLKRIASAGALIHTALHEEAGLCVAEALAVRTPVACLDRGGPPTILKEWPDTPSVAVPAADATSTARKMAAAIDDFLAHPPDVRQSPLRSQTSFEEQLLRAYERAVQTASAARHRLRPVVWGFPRGKPQVFANTPRGVGSGISVYAFGRQVPTAVQAAAVAQMAIPGLRSVLAERHDRPDPVCGWDTWDSILHQVRLSRQRVPADWVHFRSQWPKQRTSALALDDTRTPRFLVVVEPGGKASLHPKSSVESFRVPVCLDSFEYDGWHVRVVEPLPKYHQATAWELTRIRRVVQDIPKLLDGLLVRPRGMPAHWTPLHGDFVPWNLRESTGGQLWLVDWEDAKWGPPLADAVRYLVADCSLKSTSSVESSYMCQMAFKGDPVDLGEVAHFWLTHHNFQPDHSDRDQPRHRASEAERVTREVETFRIIAAS
jgi:glycosyltransferase involved in cell wall biosynthesis